jgi:hypothetical protein
MSCSIFQIQYLLMGYFALVALVTLVGLVALAALRLLISYF